MVKILFYLFIILSCVSNSYAKSANYFNIYKNTNNIKQHKNLNIDKNEVEKGKKIILAIKDLYLAVESFKDKVVQFILKIINIICGKNIKNETNIIFVYR